MMLMTRVFQIGPREDRARRPCRTPAALQGLSGIGIPSRGDDTKVRKFSGSRSCGDARALSNSSWNTIFKVPGGAARWQCTEKICFAIKIRPIKLTLFTLQRRPDALRGVFQPLNRHEFTLDALNRPIWVLSNRTICALSCRHPKMATLTGFEPVLPP